MGNTRYFLSNSREILVFPAGMGNTHKSREFANPASFSIGSSSFLQVSRTCMKAWMSSNFSKFATELRPLIDVRI